MKIAYISFGHFDTSATLVKHLSEEEETDFYFVLSQNRKRESIIDVKGSIPTGIVDNISEVEKVLDKKVLEYLGNCARVRLVCYYDLKFKNPKNIDLSYKLGKYLGDRKYDVIHFDGNDLQQVWISIFTSDIPKIHTIHDYIGHTGERKDWAERFNRLLMRSRSQKILHLQCNKDDFKKYADRLNCIYYGPLDIYRSWGDKGISEEGNSLLFFGRISPYKGLKYLVKAVPIIKEYVQDLKVIIAGEGSFDFDIEDLRGDSAFNILNRYIPNDELVRLIQKASLVVCPYTDATQSGVVMTAFAFCKPVVASKVGGIPEVVKDNVTGILVTPRDENSLAEAIVELLSNSPKRERIKRNIEIECINGRLSWEVITRQTIDVYKKALYSRSKI